MSYDCPFNSNNEGFIKIKESNFQLLFYETSFVCLFVFTIANKQILGETISGDNNNNYVPQLLSFQRYKLLYLNVQQDVIHSAR